MHSPPERPKNDGNLTVRCPDKPKVTIGYIVVIMICPACKGNKRFFMADMFPFPCGYCGGAGEVPDSSPPLSEYRLKFNYREK